MAIIDDDSTGPSHTGPANDGSDPYSTVPNPTADNPIDLDTELDNVTVGPRPYALRSEVHTKFKKTGQHDFICLICNASIRRNKQSSTTSLWDHLKGSHRVVHDELKGSSTKKRKELVVEMMQNAEPPAKIKKYGGITYETTKLEIARVISCCNLPFSIVDDKDFRRWSCYCAQADIDIPSARVAKEVVEYVYVGMKLDLKAHLEKIDYVSLTCDSWTTESEIDLLGVTVHWIDNAWQLQHKVLTIRELPRGQSGESMSDVLLSALKEFDLKSKIAGITTDNASTKGRMMKYLEEELKAINPSFNSNNQVLCLSHIINLIVQAGLMKLQLRRRSSPEYIEEPLDDTDNMFQVEDSEDESAFSMGAVLVRLRELIRTIRDQPTRGRNYREFCDTLRTPNRNKLPMDVPTQWNSTFGMLQAAIPKKKVLSNMAIVLKAQGNYIITPDEWTTLEAYKEILRPFAGAINISCITKTLSIHTVLGMMTLINTHLETMLARMMSIECGEGTLTLQQKKTIVGACKAMLAKSAKYTSILQHNLLLNFAAFLHPAIKLAPVEFDRHCSVLSHMRTQVLLLGDAEDEVSQRRRAEDHVSSSAADLMSAAFKILTPRSVHSTVSVSQNEIDDYINGSFYSTQDALVWWRDTGAAQFPKLAKLARKFLSIPITSAPSERLFSAGRAVATYNRGSLDAATIEALTTLKAWLKSFKKTAPKPHPSPVEDEWEDA